MTEIIVMHATARFSDAVYNRPTSCDSNDARPKMERTRVGNERIIDVVTLARQTWKRRNLLHPGVVLVPIHVRHPCNQADDLAWFAPRLGDDLVNCRLHVLLGIGVPWMGAARSSTGEDVTGEVSA